MLSVNTGNSTSEISKSDLTKIYTGKKSSWSDGSKIKACIRKLDSDIGKQFLKDYVKKSVDDYQAVWMEKMLSGSGNPPKSLSSDGDVIEFVSENKGAVGVIDETSLTDKVKTTDS